VPLTAAGTQRVLPVVSSAPLITHSGGMALSSPRYGGACDRVIDRDRPVSLGSASTQPPLADASDLPPVNPHQPPWPGREVSSGGVTLHVRETPGPEHATPAVYIHGLSGSATNWTDLAAQLAPHAAGMAVDLPGFGRSRPLLSGDYRPEAHADAVLCFLAGRQRPVHLVGNSLGGVIAMMVAARRPELVSTLTLLAPAMPDRRPDPRRMSDPWALLGLVPWLRPRVAARQSQYTPRDRVQQMIDLCFGEPSAVLAHRVDEAVTESLERASQPWAGEALWRTSLGMVAGWFVGARLWSIAARVHVPTLVVWGGRDRLVSPRLGPRTARTLRNARLLTLPEVGHIPQLEQPVTVARAVLGLWQTAQAGAW
jgi:pimeloyl-ACP methyl ester carboxylesterase